jgi:cytidine deaminase
VTSDASSAPNAPDADRLLKEARTAVERAYAPYSKFSVGAAVTDESGRVFTGVNIENASYGLTMCAERVAIFSAVAAGARRITAVAVTAKGAAGVTPCGACRQVMAEFCAPDTPVYCDRQGADALKRTVAELLPDAFTPADLSAPRKTQV